MAQKKWEPLILNLQTTLDEPACLLKLLTFWSTKAVVRVLPAATKTNEWMKHLKCEVDKSWSPPGLQGDQIKTSLRLVILSTKASKLWKSSWLSNENLKTAVMALTWERETAVFPVTFLAFWLVLQVKWFTLFYESQKQQKRPKWLLNEAHFSGLLHLHSFHAETSLEHLPSQNPDCPLIKALRQNIVFVNNRFPHKKHLIFCL